MRLEVQKLQLPLKAFEVELDFVSESATTIFFGPSGSGKSSLIEWMAGMRPEGTGRFVVDGTVMQATEQGIRLPSRERGIGYMPQDLALFPHLTALENLKFPMRFNRSPPIVLAQLIGMLELEKVLDQTVLTLSGGEVQRVALGRAVMACSKLLLLDEPLASLDAPLKARLLPFIRRIQTGLKLPMVYVTHDRAEAIALGGELVVMNRGRILQQGTVEAVFRGPKDLSAAGILSVETIQLGIVIERHEDRTVVKVGTAQLISSSTTPSACEAVHVCVRAEDVMVTKSVDAAGSARNRLKAIVRGVEPYGQLVRVDLDCGFPLVALLTRQASEELSLGLGIAVEAVIKAPNIHLIPV